MAEEPKEPTQGMEGESAGAAPKKKGKLPAIVMLAVLLGGGGFFGMKMRQPKEQKEPAIKLGETIAPKEFLVNLSGGKVYLRTEIRLQLKEGVKIEAGGEGEGAGGAGTMMDTICDAIILVLTAKNQDQVSSPDGKLKLKREIAAAVNAAIEAYEAGKKGEPLKKAEEAAKANQPPKHPEWDSDTGPVLKVYFTSFATQ